MALIAAHLNAGVILVVTVALLLSLSSSTSWDLGPRQYLQYLFGGVGVGWGVGGGGGPKPETT